MANKVKDGKHETKYGDIYISPKVVAKTAGLAACERFAKRFVCMRRLFFVTLCGIYE